jgi:hypothetical protein
MAVAVAQQSCEDTCIPKQSLGTRLRVNPKSQVNLELQNREKAQPTNLIFSRLFLKLTWDLGFGIWDFERSSH